MLTNRNTFLPLIQLIQLHTTLLYNLYTHHAVLLIFRQGSVFRFLQICRVQQISHLMATKSVLGDSGLQQGHRVATMMMFHLRREYSSECPFMQH